MALLISAFLDPRSLDLISLQNRKSEYETASQV